MLGQTFQDLAHFLKNFAVWHKAERMADGFMPTHCDMIWLLAAPYMGLSSFFLQVSLPSLGHFTVYTVSDHQQQDLNMLA